MTKKCNLIVMIAFTLSGNYKVSKLIGKYSINVSNYFIRITKMI